jgi:hypothetical protein
MGAQQVLAAAASLSQSSRGSTVAAPVVAAIIAAAIMLLAALAVYKCRRRGRRGSRSAARWVKVDGIGDKAAATPHMAPITAPQPFKNEHQSADQSSHATYQNAGAFPMYRASFVIMMSLHRFSMAGSIWSNAYNQVVTTRYSDCKLGVSIFYVVQLKA